MVRDAFSKVWSENRNLRLALEAEQRRSLSAVAEHQPHLYDQFGYGQPYRSQTLCRCSDMIEGILSLLENDLVSYSISSWENKLAVSEADRDRLAMT